MSCITFDSHFHGNISNTQKIRCNSSTIFGIAVLTCRHEHYLRGRYGNQDAKIPHGVRIMTIFSKKLTHITVPRCRYTLMKEFTNNYQSQKHKRSITPYTISYI